MNAETILLAHRVAWLYMTGHLPPATIDHKNGDGADNRWTNLRAATYSQQNANRKTRKDSRSGLKGATLHWSGRWHATIKRGGRRKSLGMFDTAEEAHAAYLAAMHVYHGEFARAG